MMSVWRYYGMLRADWSWLKLICIAQKASFNFFLDFVRPLSHDVDYIIFIKTKGVNTRRYQEAGKFHVIVQNKRNTWDYVFGNGGEDKQRAGIEEFTTGRHVFGFVARKWLFEIVAKTRSLREVGSYLRGMFGKSRVFPLYIARWFGNRRENHVKTGDCPVFVRGRRGVRRIAEGAEAAAASEASEELEAPGGRLLRTGPMWILLSRRKSKELGSVPRTGESTAAPIVSSARAEFSRTRCFESEISWDGARTVISRAFCNGARAVSDTAWTDISDEPTAKPPTPGTRPKSKFSESTLGAPKFPEYSKCSGSRRKHPNLSRAVQSVSSTRAPTRG